MEPLNDQDLQDLLRRWDAPPAPAHLEKRIFGERKKQPWYRWLVTGSVPVPVPALVLLLLALSVLSFVLPRNRQATFTLVREVRLSDFQPVAELKPRIIRGAQ
jgi:hypothetical protein